MTNADAPHRYQAQRDRIDALAMLATRQARESDRLASRSYEDRSRHLADFDRMFRCVRAAAAWVVRLDQAAEGRLPAARQHAEARAPRTDEAVPPARAPAQPGLTGLPHLPDLDAFAPADRDDAPLPEPRPPKPAPEPDLLADLTVRAPRPVTERRLRDSLLAATAPDPAPPIRRTG